MGRDISHIHAERLERTAPEENTFMAYVNENGVLYASLELDARALRLRPGRVQQVRAVPYRVVVKDGEPKAHPVALPNGRVPCVLVGVRAEPGQDFAHVDVRASLPSLADTWAKVVVERVRAPRARIAAAGMATLAIAAGLALGTWGDPTARRGHYEGKTDEEIQADLDADVAWYVMEISVASAMTVPEGETTIEARIENPEANHCDQKVRILTEDGEELFASGAIAPGEYLQTVDLRHPLPVGTHTLTVEFQGYEQTPTLISNEGVPLGHDTFGASCAAEVELTVVPMEA